MPQGQEQFEIVLNEMTVPVQEFHMQGQSFFRVMIPGKPPLTILRANHQEGHKFWTSVPEGKQALAESIGPLIEKHFRTKK
jgi:hypothetical protein